MEKPCPACQPKEARVCNFHEVSLGLNKKIAQDESRRCPQCAVATCLPGCPLGIDIPGFIRLLREGQTILALERIKKENPFPAICGRICPAPCEEACIFHADGEPIAIRALERFAADFGQNRGQRPILFDKLTSKNRAPSLKKVAVIGSGPAGMSAAYYLAKTDLGVTIFEAAHQPGGLLRYAVPEFRLPQKVLDEQFSQLKSLGVQIQTDVVFGRTMMIDELLMRGFSAVLLATGAGLPVFSGLPGSDLAGVYYDVEFLNRLQAVNKEDVPAQAGRQGIPAAKTVIVGGGPAAFDAARLSLRLGSQTKLVFDGFEEQAGVDHEILKESKEEGLEILSMRVLEIVGDDKGFVRGVKCRKMDIVEGKDGLKLEPSVDEPVFIEAWTVIMANGRRPNSSVMDSAQNVFTCNNSESVAVAIANGKAAAQKIILSLRGA